MATTFQDYDGDGDATFQFSFPSYKEADIKVDVDGVIKTSGNHYNITSYTTTGGGNVVFTSGNIPADSSNKIRIYRDTDVDTAKATFTAGSAVKAADLNNNMTQLLYAAQEEQNQTIKSSDIKDGSIKTIDIGADQITNALIADDQIDSEHYVAGSIDLEHMSANSVDSDQYVDGSIDLVHMSANSVDSDQYVDGSIDLVHMSANSVDSDQYVDGSIDLVHMSANSVDSDQYVDGSIDHVHLSNDCIDGDNIQDDVINSEHYVAGSIDHEHLANDIIDGDNIQDDVINTEHYAPTSINALALASNSVTEGKITDLNVTTTKLADNAVTIGKIGCEQTTISNSDSHIPTSGAVVDYVAAQIAPIGGLEVVATDAAFPNVQPQAGVVISISDAGGVVFNGSGSSTTARTVGGSTVTINNAPSSLNNETLVAGVGLMVSSTGSGQIYNYHKILGKEDDIKQLSDDINDFNARYRVGTSNPSTALDGGDLFFNTTTGKLLVYNNTNTAWEEAQSIGNFFISTLSPAFDNSTQNFTLTNAPTNAQQLILSINGVIQKPNAGTSTPSEGFALDGSTVKLASAPASGSDYFAIVMGSTVNIGTPSDGTVTAGKLTSGAVETAKLADGAVTEVKLGVSNSPTNGYFLSAQSGNSGGLTWAQVTTDLVGDTSPQLGGDLDTNGFDIDLDSGKAVTFDGKGDIRYQSGQFQITTSTGDILIDNNYNGGDVKIYTNTDFEVYVNDGEEAIVAKQNGAVELYHNDVKKLETSATGVTVTGTVAATSYTGDGSSLTGINTDLVSDTSPQLGGNLDTNSKHITFGDSSSSSVNRLKFGANEDLQILHDGSNSYITNAATGDASELYIRGTGNNIEIQAKNGEKSAKFIPDGAVELYHDNAKKFETVSNGVSVTGSLLIGDSSSGRLEIGASQDLQIYHDASTGHNYINSYNGALIFRDTNTNFAYFHNSDGHFLPWSNNTFDLGSSGNRWRNVYTNDLNLSNEGGANDVDGTWGDWTIQEGASDLFLKNNRSGKKYKFNLTEVS